MGFFRILLRIVTFGILGKDRTAAEVYTRKKLANQAKAQQQLAQKLAEQEAKKQLKSQKEKQV